MKLLARYLQQLPPNTRSIILTCLFGLIAGLVGVAFHIVIEYIFKNSIVRLTEVSFQFFAIGSFVVIMVTSLISGWLLTHFCKEAAGSGIPQVKLAFWKDFGVIPFRVVWVKFIAGALSVGGGCSLGREGPSVQIGSGLASMLAGWMGVAKQARRTSAAAGAAAGLAAAFNTPLAAMTFVLEEVVEDLNSRILGAMIFASVIGALVVRAVIGDNPAFIVPEISSVRWHVTLLIPVVAALASLAGVVFQKGSMEVRERTKVQRFLPAWMMPGVGGFTTWILAVSVFYCSGHLGIFGLGYTDLSSAVADQMVWYTAGMLLLAKLVATVVSYGTGGCGGIFAPTLFFGGMCAVFFVGLIEEIFPLTKDEHVLFTVVGMSACLGAVVRAPVTSILIVFEMTHEFALLPGLMVGSIVSQFIGRRLCKENFYQELLTRDGVKLEHIIPPRDLQTWQNYQVSAIARFDLTVAEDLSVEGLKKLLDENEYDRFPVVENGVLCGVMTRAGALRAIMQNERPELMGASTCLRTQKIKEIQLTLIEAESGMVVVLDREGGKPIGLLTLHDMLRAERRLVSDVE